MKLLHIYDPIHRQNYYGALGMNTYELKERVKAFTGVSIDDMSFDGLGKSFYIDTKAGRLVFIWVKDKKDTAILLHEIVHALAFVLPKRGYDFNEYQEIYSYCSEFLYRSLTGKIKIIYKLK